MSSGNYNPRGTSSHGLTESVQTSGEFDVPPRHGERALETGLVLRGGNGRYDKSGNAIWFGHSSSLNGWHLELHLGCHGELQARPLGASSHRLFSVD